MADPFPGYTRGRLGPASFHRTIVPSDTVDIPTIPRGIYCNAAGTAVLRDSAGNNVTYTLEAGQILPFSPVRVMATGTTAELVGWW